MNKVVKTIEKLHLLQKLNARIGELRDASTSRPPDERLGYLIALGDMLGILSDYLVDSDPFDPELHRLRINLELPLLSSISQAVDRHGTDRPLQHIDQG